METKKTRIKTVLPTKPESDVQACKVSPYEDTQSQCFARAVTGSVLSALTLEQFSGGGDVLKLSDLFVEMRKAGDEAVAGDLGRVERMLANQLLSLDLLFNNLAQRSGRHESFKGIEVLMRLALKAQAQARATAETLSIIKNPMPYIKQANIAQGPQQINNSQPLACAGKLESTHNKLLEVENGNGMDSGAQTAPSRSDQDLEAVGAFNGAKNARRKKESGR